MNDIEQVQNVAISNFRRWSIFACCILVGLTNDVSGGVLNLAIAPMTKDLSLSQTDAQTVLTIGRLLFGAFIIAGGVLGDLYGRRRVLVIGAGGVVLASLLAATAQSSGMLVTARFLDGIANAAIAPLAVAILISVFPPADQAKIVGIFLGFTGLGVALGPLGVGVLLEAFGWRAGFAGPLILAIIGGLGILFLAPASPPPEKGLQFDYPGAAASVIGLLGIVFGIIELNNGISFKLLFSLAIGVAGLAFFVWWEGRVREPLLDIKLFSNRTFASALLAGFTMGLISGGVLLPLLYFIQKTQETNLIGAVVRILPMVVAAVLFSPIVGNLVEKWGARRVIVSGLGAVALASLGFSFIQPRTPYALILILLVIFGAGNIAILAPVMDTILNCLPPEKSGSASAINTAATQIGGAIGVASLTSIFLLAGRNAYFEKLEPTGLSREKIAEINKLLKQTQESLTTGLQTIPDSVRDQFNDATQFAFAIGINRIFALTCILCLICGIFVLLGMKSQSQQKSKIQ